MILYCGISWLISFTFQAYTLPHALNCICVSLFEFHIWSSYLKFIFEVHIWSSYLNFKAVLALPKMAHSAQTYKSISFIWIVWSTLYVYLWPVYKLQSYHYWYFDNATSIEVQSCYSFFAYLLNRQSLWIEFTKFLPIVPIESLQWMYV